MKILAAKNPLSLDYLLSVCIYLKCPFLILLPYFFLPLRANHIVLYRVIFYPPESLMHVLSKTLTFYEMIFFVIKQPNVKTLSAKI